MESLSVEELEIKIGEYLLKDTLGSKKVSNSDKRRAVQNWLNANRAVFQRVICENEKIKRLIGEKGADEISIFSALCDLLITYFSFMPISTLSTLLIKRGLVNLCKD